jgi:hypothetical protein
VAAAEEGRCFLGAVAGTSAARGDGGRGGHEAVEVAGEVEGRWSHRVGTESEGGRKAVGGRKRLLSGSNLKKLGPDTSMTCYAGVCYQ